MARPHYRKQPGNGPFTRQLGNRPGPSDQAGVRVGPRVVKQSTIDKWDAGVAKLDAEYAKWSKRPHTFIRVGTWEFCDKCGQRYGATYRSRSIHTGIKKAE